MLQDVYKIFCGVIFCSGRRLILFEMALSMSHVSVQTSYWPFEVTREKLDRCYVELHCGTILGKLFLLLSDLTISHRKLGQNSYPKRHNTEWLISRVTIYMNMLSCEQKRWGHKELLRKLRGPVRASGKEPWEWVWCLRSWVLTALILPRWKKKKQTIRDNLMTLRLSFNK